MVCSGYVDGDCWYHHAPILVATGYAGQITLAPFTLAGIGSVAAARASEAWHVPFLVAVLIGIVAGASGRGLGGAPFDARQGA